MKKILVFCLLFCCILLAGCSNDNNSTKKEDNTNKDLVLSCSRSSTESSINFSTEMIYYFKNSKLDKLGVKYTYDLSAYSEEQRKVFASSKMCELDSMTTTLGMTDCKEELSGSSYIVSGYADKLLAQSSGNLNDIRSSYEKDGWTCSVK